MKQLFLADFEEMSDKNVREKIIEDYSDILLNKNYYNVSDSLKEFDLLIAYQSVGSWGCDSSAWFLLRHKKNGNLYEVNASHCSCYGFEGQWEPEESSIEYLTSDFFFYAGGYDEDEEENKRKIFKYISKLKKENDKNV